MKQTESPLSHAPQLPLNELMMLILGLMVGVIAGLGAIVFRLMIGFVHNLLYYGQFNFVYHATEYGPPSVWGVGIILVPVIGAVVVTWLVENFAMEAKGHGVPEVIDAIYYNKGIIKPIVAVIKSIASAVSIGSGGSVGREGPIVQIGSAFGSTLGQWITMPVRQRIVLIAAGAGAGIAATFNAPIGGIAFAMELLLVSINARTMMVVIVSTITATTLSRYYLGMNPAFDIPALAAPQYHTVGFTELSFFLPLGVGIGLAATLFIHSIYWFEDWFEATIKNPYVRHMLGMLGLGIIMYAFIVFAGQYFVDGVGYAAIMDMLRGFLDHPWFLLLLFAGKLLATGLTLGSGASGGVFSPSLFLGASFGGAYGAFAQDLLPSMHTSPAVFAVAGMAGMVSGSTGAIITAITMLFEMTRDYNAIMPIAITVALAYGTRILLSKESIYTLKLLRRNHVIQEGLQAALSAGRTVSHVMSKAFQSISYTVLVKQSQPDIANTSADLLLVVENNEFVGILAPKDYPQGEAELNKNFIVMPPDLPLLDGLRDMHRQKAKALIVSSRPLTNDASAVLGVITEKDIANFSLEASELMS